MKEVSDKPTASTLAPRPRRSAWWTALNSLLFFTSLAVVASWAARWAWFLDLASHFRVQYAMVLTTGALLLLFGRWFKTGLVFAVIAGTQIWTVAPFYTTPHDFTEAEAKVFPRESFPVEELPPNPWGAGGQVGAPLGPLPTSGPSSRRVRILEANVHSNNIEYKRFISLVREEQPDLIAVLEFNNAWQQALMELQQSYSFTYFAPQPGNFGIALYSRHMIVVEEFQLGSEGFPALVANCSLPSGPLTLVAAHPVPPMSGANSELRNDQLEHLANIVQGERGMAPVAPLDEEGDSEEDPSPPPLMVVGDFNCTSWSPYFGDLLEATDLRDSRLGWGVQTTWPAKLPAPLRIPIDHCLISPDLKVIERRVGAGIGSDHLPIIIDLVLPAASDGAEVGDLEGAGEAASDKVEADEMGSNDGLE